MRVALFRRADAKVKPCFMPAARFADDSAPVGSQNAPRDSG